ncbi:hypothetical protein [Bradyrhizobium sp. USDA 4529]
MSNTEWVFQGIAERESLCNLSSSDCKHRNCTLVAGADAAAVSNNAAFIASVARLDYRI